jgi:hypothetical protein
MRLDRRRFLVGAGGAALALPLLEALWPSRVRANAISPPRRFVLITHGQGAPFERWAPPAPGPLPASGPISAILEPLSHHRDRLLLVSGVDNAVRYSVNDFDGHGPANTTLLTANHPMAGPSIDFVVGQRIGAGTERPSVLIQASPDDSASLYHYSSVAGTVQATQALSGNPLWAAQALFTNLRAPNPILLPSRRERLQAQRQGILGAVRSELAQLRRRLPAEDRERLDVHVEHIRAIEARSGPPVPRPENSSCRRPDFGAIPDLVPNGPNHGDRDDASTPAQVDNLVRALACDITRVASLQFGVSHGPRFPWLFGGDPQAVSAGYGDWHDMIHQAWTNDQGSPSPLSRIVTGFKFYSESVARLLDGLAAAIDLDGRPLLDSTLVLWISDFGDASVHRTTNLPVVMAGLGSAFQKGRYLDLRATRPTTGDLYAQVLRLLGSDDQTFGRTGTIEASYADPTDTFVRGYPLHRGPLPL